MTPPQEQRATTAPQPSTPADHRWPRSVYGVGDEPDPRFSLANERTFLAWIRTSLGLLAAGAAVDALDLPMPDRVQSALAAVLALVALLASLQAWRGWARTERAMRLRQPLPSTTLAMPIAVGIALVAVFLVVVTLA